MAIFQTWSVNALGSGKAEIQKTVSYQILTDGNNGILTNGNGEIGHAMEGLTVFQAGHSWVRMWDSDPMIKPFSMIYYFDHRKHIQHLRSNLHRAHIVFFSLHLRIVESLGVFVSYRNPLLCAWDKWAVFIRMIAGHHCGKSGGLVDRIVIDFRKSNNRFAIV